MGGAFLRLSAFLKLEHVVRLGENFWNGRGVSLWVNYIGMSAEHAMSISETESGVVVSMVCKGLDYGVKLARREVHRLGNDLNDLVFVF